MKFRVVLLESAKRDLIEIHQYVALSDSQVNADRLLTLLEKSCLNLCAHPEHGHYPTELQRVAVREFRETHFKPYCTIYRLMQETVVIHCVLDGRRDLVGLLLQRLLR